MTKILGDNGLPVPAYEAAISGKGLERSYMQLVGMNKIEFDHGQWEVLQQLQYLLDSLCEIKPRAKRSLWPQAKSPNDGEGLSLYIFGDVGRGKSMLVQLFYDACPEAVKRRIHFNAFMIEVHQFIHQSRRQGGGDALIILAKKIKASYQVLCFDEFHVTDIADAMILGRLLSILFELGVVLVITSNRHPNELYQGGIQKEQFHFFLKVLSGHAKIIELTAQKDYRSVLNRQQEAYYFPLDKHEPEFILKKYQEFSGDTEMKPLVLDVFRHQLNLSATNGNVVLVEFEELCAKPLGSIDYLALVEQFCYVIIRGIPKLSADKRNEARRFVNLIDVLYEHKIRLVCTAEVPPHLLYEEGDGAFEFKRAVSRLLEMQSQKYWQHHTADVMAN